MPNWCSNKLQLTHDNPAVIAKAIEGFKAGDFLQTFLPCPQELLDAVKGFSRDHQDEIDRVAAANMEKFGFPTWYEFKTEVWGTKWDVGGDDGKVDQISDNTVILDFDSAYAPPVAAYAKLEALGFNIRAYYYEPGMCFCGSYVTGEGDKYMEFEYDADWIRKNVPQLVEEAFGIAEQIAAYQDEEEEDEVAQLSFTPEAV